jgi:hypothetical protein
MDACNAVAEAYTYWEQKISFFVFGAVIFGFLNSVFCYLLTHHEGKALKFHITKVNI